MGCGGRVARSVRIGLYLGGGGGIYSTVLCWLRFIVDRKKGIALPTIEHRVLQSVGIGVVGYGKWERVITCARASIRRGRAEFGHGREMRAFGNAILLSRMGCFL